MRKMKKEVKEEEEGRQTTLEPAVLRGMIEGSCKSLARRSN